MKVIFSKGSWPEVDLFIFRRNSTIPLWLCFGCQFNFLCSKLFGIFQWTQQQSFSVVHMLHTHWTPLSPHLSFRFWIDVLWWDKPAKFTHCIKVKKYDPKKVVGFLLMNNFMNECSGISPTILQVWTMGVEMRGRMMKWKPQSNDGENEDQKILDYIFMFTHRVLFDGLFVWFRLNVRVLDRRSCQSFTGCDN